MQPPGNWAPSAFLSPEVKVAENKGGRIRVDIYSSKSKFILGFFCLLTFTGEPESGLMNFRERV